MLKKLLYLILAFALLGGTLPVCMAQQEEPPAATPPAEGRADETAEGAQSTPDPLAPQAALQDGSQEVQSSADEEEFPPLLDPGHISDEAFFGQWDPGQNKWAREPLLQYEAYSGLGRVRQAAVEGNYAEAKDLLLAYYRSRDPDMAFQAKGNDKYSISAETVTEHIICFDQMDAVISQVTVKPDWDYYVADLSGDSKVRNSYMLFDVDMDGTTAEVVSRENAADCPAVLEVVANGVKKEYRASADTYISAGRNKNENYGASDTLYVREAAESDTIPFGGDTKRAYLQFDTSDLTGAEAITSIKLRIYARSAAEKEKKLFVLTTANEDQFKEMELTWAKHYPQAFNFKQTGFIWGLPEYTQGVWGTEFEWVNAVTRMFQSSALVGRYISTKNEKYAYAAMELAISMYTQQPSGRYPRILECGWRTTGVLRVIFGCLNSRYMTGETLTGLVKYMYAHAIELKDANEGGANWVSGQVNGFVRTCAYLPEISQPGWWEHAKTRLRGLYEKDMVNADGSYPEACSNYIVSTISEFRSAIELVTNIDGTDDPLYTFLIEKYRALSEYYFNMAMNYGDTIPYGDGSRNDIRSFAKTSHEFDPNPAFEYFSTKGLKGAAPAYTSRLYTGRPIAFLRSDWTPEGLSAAINADHGGSHSHYDDLALDVYAFGAPLLVDAGTSSYSPGSAAAESRLATRSHNTIEIDNKNQRTTGVQKPDSIAMKTNGLFDLVHAKTDDAYTGFDVNRKVLFLKKSGWIVSDYILPPAGAHTYRQAWHPDARNNLTVDPKTKVMRTNFSNQANISVVPADPESLEAVRDKEYLVTNDLPELEDYVRYERIDAEGPQTFDTVLYPDRLGTNTEIGVTRLQMEGVSTETATALSIDFDGDRTGTYYLCNETAFPQRTFGGFTYNGEMAYVEKKRDGSFVQAAITGGTSLIQGNCRLFWSEYPVEDLGLEWGPGVLYLYSSAEKPAGDLKVYAPGGIQKVVYNGEDVAFTYEDDTVTTRAEEKSGSGGGIPAGSPGGVGKPSGSLGGGFATPVPTPTPTASESPAPTPSETPDATPAPFTDITGHWAEKEIGQMAEAGILNGREQGKFCPDETVTRAEFTAILVKVLKLPLLEATGALFTDVPKDSWYAAAVEAAAEQGLVSGTGDGKFAPDREISRQEIAKLAAAACARYEQEKPPAGSLEQFADSGDIAPWALDAVAAAVGLGLMSGTQTDRFSPEERVTRAQAAVILYRLSKRIGT